MADKLEGRAQAILAAPNPAVLSIPRKDGTIQSVVVWAHAEEGEVTVNGAEGRAWPANLRRAKTATVTATNDGSAYEYVAVTVSLIDEVGPPAANDHIDMLTKKYTGLDKYPYPAGELARIKFLLKPERVLYVDMR